MKSILILFALTTTAFGQLSFNAGVTSDYIARGTSQTLGDFGYSFGADYNFAKGYYLGSWTSNVDFGDGTDQEIDFWVGYRHAAGPWNLDYSLSIYGYTNDPVPYEMFEGRVILSRTFGKTTFTETVAYSPDYFNILDQSVWMESSITYALTPKLGISVAGGYQYIQGGGSYGCGNVGLCYKVNDHISLDVRYSDTTDHLQGKAWESALSISLKTTF
jgi:uncharacterized protein (TIGR02001 family)